MKSTASNQNKPHRLKTEEQPEKDSQSKLAGKLQVAMKLWNSIHEKSKILFTSGNEIKSVETPVWFVSEKFVCIYAGVILPISCIIDVVI